MGAWGITRCARLPGTDLGFLTNDVDYAAQTAVVRVFPQNTGTDNYGTGFVSIFGRPQTFPYGYDVH